MPVAHSDDGGLARLVECMDGIDALRLALDRRSELAELPPQLHAHVVAQPGSRRAHMKRRPRDACALFHLLGVVPLAFFAAGSGSQPAQHSAYAGEIGVVVFDVPDTAKARAFHAGLFGRTYHPIGSHDLWWMDHLAVGIFKAPATAVRFWCVVGAREPAMAKVRALGGHTGAAGSMGPYQVCECQDDQGTPFNLWWDASLGLTWPA